VGKSLLPVFDAMEIWGIAYQHLLG